MKFTIEREKFLNGLQRISGIVDPRGTVPILSNLLIETVSPDTITISATDLEISFKGEYNAIVDSIGSVTVNAKKVFDIVRELQENKIDFSTDENNWVTILCGSSKFNIPGLHAEEFPSIPSCHEDGVIRINTLSLKDMIKRVILSVSNDDTRYALTGALLEIEGSKIKMVSTDGHRLAYIEIDEITNESNKDKISIIIPKKTLAEILKMEDKGDYVQISFSDNYAVLKKEANILISRVIEEQFPDHNEVIPEKFRYRVTADKDKLMHALRRVSILADEKSKMVKFDIRNNNMLTLISDAAGFGGATEDVPVVYEGENMIIGLNAAYILDVLPLLSDEIYIDIIDPVSAALIGCPKSIAYKYIIMPMRIRTENEEE